MSKEHGRIEKRTYYTVSDADDIRNIVPNGWESVRCIGMARLEREVNGEKSLETHFHVMDTELFKRLIYEVLPEQRSAE